MDIDFFSKVCKRVLDKHFKLVEQMVNNGSLKMENGSRPSISYPTMMVCVKTKEVFSVELVGASEKFQSLRIKKPKIESFERLISLKEEVAGSGYKFTFGSKGSGLTNLLICTADGKTHNGLSRFPIANHLETRLFFSGNTYNTISFPSYFITARLTNIVLASMQNDAVRARYILEMLIFKLDINEDDLIELLEEYCKFPENNQPSEIFCVNEIPSEILKSDVKVSYLHNMVLSGDIHETTIGDYLNDHPEIILRSLGYDSMLYEPTLDWIEKPEGCNDQYINPDLLLKNNDGNYDICDLKTGLTKKKSLTKGERRRRRFIDSVNEGLSQLANYEEYFQYEKNAESAKEKYGVTVKDPLKILIIGNQENADALEIQQSLRGMINVIVIDYDSIIKLYLSTVLKKND